jgi:DNA invertase Pin-like site-specific DNA recombinase
MKSQNGKGKVFSYMRWSSEPQTWGDSERRQAQQAVDWCQRNGRVLDERSFTGRGVSGWKGANREFGKLAALLKEVVPGDTILLEDASRWSREELEHPSPLHLQSQARTGTSLRHG